MYKDSSQERADKKYREKIASNPEERQKRNIRAQYRSAKSYIKNHLTLEEVSEFEQLINKRKKQLYEKN